MYKYKKPAIKIKKIRLNSFLVFGEPISNLPSFDVSAEEYFYEYEYEYQYQYQYEYEYEYPQPPIVPPRTGTAGLKDSKFKVKLLE